MSSTRLDRGACTTSPAAVSASSYAPPAGDPAGQVFALLAIAIAAGEAAVGLAIFLALYETHGTTELDKIRLLRW